MKKYGLMFADQGSAGYITSDIDAGYDTMQTEINHGGALRIALSTTNFDIVQNIEPITRYFDPGTVTCGSKTANDNPTWQPTWIPSCPAVGSSSSSSSTGSDSGSGSTGASSSSGDSSSSGNTGSGMKLEYSLSLLLFSIVFLLMQ